MLRLSKLQRLSQPYYPASSVPRVPRARPEGQSLALRISCENRRKLGRPKGDWLIITSARVTCNLGKPPGEELTFDLPGLAIRLKRFSDPVKGVGGNFGEPPASWSAVRTGTYLHNVLAA